MNIKISKAKENELVVWDYFMPKTSVWLKRTDDDIKMFFEWSEQGKHKDKSGGMAGGVDNSYFNGLKEGKRWAGIHMHELYEQGVIEGSTPYFTLLGGCDEVQKRKWFEFWKPKYKYINVPILRQVVDFMKKEMFKGKDSDLIEKVYQDILQNK